MCHPKKEQRKKTSAGERGQVLLSRYQHVLKHRFGDLPDLLSKLKDTRKRKNYEMEDVAMGGIFLFLLKFGSRNNLNNKRREESFVAHCERTLGFRLPHQDTIAKVLRKLPPEQLEKVKMELMSDLFNQKCLRNSRLLNKYYMVAIDATGIVSYDHPHCPHCLTKTSKKGVVTYYHYALEAKLVTHDGLCLPLATEWIENPEGDYVKQDCERKAFLRLAKTLKKNFPRLPICILADGLYPYEGVFEVCEKNEWKYIIVLPEKALSDGVQGELGEAKRRPPKREHLCMKNDKWIDSKYRFKTDIFYHKKYHLHWFQCLETRTKYQKPNEKKDKKTTEKPEEFCFEYVTNIEPTADTIHALSSGGRLRWKIENEGFNAQKCGDYELEHKYSRNSYEGLQNYYTSLQIAHAINQFVEHSSVVVEMLKEHSKETIRNIWQNLVAYMIFVSPYDGSLITPQPS